MIEEFWKSNWAKWYLLLLVVFLLSLQIYDLDLWRGSIDYVSFGTIGEWASGLGAFSAVAVAMHQLRQLRFEKEDAIDSENSSVHVWVKPIGDVQSNKIDRWVPCWVNNTSNSIYEWEVQFETGGKACNKCTGPIFPGEQDSQNFDWNEQQPPLKRNKTPKVMFTFRDCRGKIWLRNYENLLSELDKFKNNCTHP